MTFTVTLRARLVGCVGLVSLAGCSPGASGGPRFGPADGGFLVVDMAIQGPPAPLQPPPQFPPTVEQAVTPPALSGGTLAVLADGSAAVAADPDRDHVYVVDLAQAMVRADVALDAGDEPGRVAIDAAGRAHVALRRGGSLVTIDTATGTVLARRDVCAAPRGVAYQAATDSVHVACAGGELVTLPAAGGDATRVLHLDRDLRDVVVDGNALRVTRFRTAELLTIASDGSIQSRESPPRFQSKAVHNADPFAPAIAWRALASPTGGVVMVHQRGDAAEVTPTAGGYGASGDMCGSGIVHGTVTVFDGATGSPTVGPALPAAVLPVDLTLSPDGTRLALVAAGNSFNVGLPQVIQLAVADVTGPSECIPMFIVGGDGAGASAGLGQATAIAYLPSGDLLVQSREPAQLAVLPAAGGITAIPLASTSRDDTGHDIFHANSGGGLACASCHAEAGDDGLVWQFAMIGPRRTQTIRGGTLGTGPFHWDGDEHDFTHLMQDVFTGRMSGPALDRGQVAALASFAGGQPPLPVSPPADSAAVVRGAALFNDATVGCASCHGGASLTNHQILDVGTGQAFKTPSMVGVAWRAPFLHDGRAATLRDRFDPSLGGADQHGTTSQLTSSQIDDLVAYLESL